MVRQPFCETIPLPHKEEITIPSQIESRQTVRKKRSAAQRRLITAVCILIAILLAAAMALLLIPDAAQAPQPTPQPQPTEPTPAPTAAPEARIPSGAAIDGIPVGGMTAQEAYDAVRAGITDIYQSEPMTVSVNAQTFTLTSEQPMAQLDIEAAVQDALNGSETSISVKLSLDRTAIEQALEKVYEELGGVYVPSGYWLEGNAPDLDEATGACQTLVLNRGSAGRLVDLQDACEKVIDAYESKTFEAELEAPGEERSPLPLDLAQVYAQVSVPAQNPRVNPKTLEIIPGRSGYGFDEEKATAMLDSAKAGEPVRISMEYIPPASEEEAWFQDILGYCKTEYSADNENRNENLRLACEKLNGIILQPGQTLSYNETLGKRTREAGYLPAPAYSGTELVDEVGGGICQVSSTLYLSALFAELNVTERKNHGFPAKYIPLGLDATVNWGTTDLKLRNDYETPVKILAEASDGFVKIKIMGVERRDYYVKMEYRVDDHPSYAAAYRCRYDRETDELIYRELDHTSTYLENVWCNPGYAECATDDP